MSTYLCVLKKWAVVVQLVASMFNCIQVVRMEKRWILVLCKTRSLQNPSQWGSKMVESKMVHTLTKTAVKTIKNLGVLDILTHKLFTFWPKPRGFLEMFPPKYQPKGHQGHQGVARGSSRILQRWLGLFRAGEGHRQQLTLLKVGGWVEPGGKTGWL